MLKEKFGDLHENLSFTRVTLARLLILFISIQFQVQYKVILYPRGSKEVHLFCMKLAFNKPRKVTKPDFQKKIWFIHKVQKCTFLSGFSTFSGNLAMNFHLFLIENDSTKCLWTACENRMFSKNPVLEIFIHKVEILAKNGKKWCLKIVLYLQNRKCYRKSDLIFGIYDKFPFTSVSFIFSLLLIFRV